MSHYTVDELIARWKREEMTAEQAIGQILLALRELVVQRLEHDGDARADDERDADPQPHPAQPVAPALLDQERGDDPHDQGGFDPFAQTDDERRQHERQPLVRE